MRIKSQLSGLSILLLLLCLGMFAAPNVSAQVDEKEKAQKEVEKRQQLERNTLALLDEIVAGLWGLKLAENRSFVLATAADLCWPHDEKRARALFWEALNNLNLPSPVMVETAAKETTGKASSKDSVAKDSAGKEQAANEPPGKSSSKVSTAKSPTKEQTQQLTRYYEVFAKRREFLLRVARRDSQLALDMLHATRQPAPPQLPGYFFVPGETDLVEEIAGAAAANDPKRALEIARQSLAKGLSFQLMNLLHQLNQQDQSAGSDFATDIMTKLDDENVGTNLIPLLLATHLLSQSRTPKTAPGESPENSVFKPLKLNDDQKRSLVTMITDAALSVTSQGSIMHNIRYVIPEIEQYAPDRVGRVKAKLAEWNRALPKEQQEWSSYDALIDSATPEQMIKAADKMGDEHRESLYQTATITAAMRGKADSFRDFLNNQVQDESRKKTLLDLLDAEQIYEAVNRGKTDDLQKLLPLIRLKEQRALAMSELAILLDKKGEHDEAVKLLDEARGLVKVNLNNNEKQSNAVLGLMLAYALVQPDKAFLIIEPIIDRFNDDISKLFLLDKIAKTGAIKNGEIILQQSNMPMDFGMFRYSRGIVALANADFNHTKSLADRFERNELRLLARLLLAQALLSNNEQTTTTK